MQAKSFTYSQANLPSNEHAYTNNVYLNPQDYQMLLQTSGTKVLYLDIKSFIVKASQEKQIKPNEMGLSKFQREAMQFGKTDEVTFRIARVTEKNPLDKVDITFDLIYVDEDYKDIDPTTKAVRIHENVILTELKELYRGMFVNAGEQVPLLLMDEQMIVRVTIQKIESIDLAKKDYRFGSITDETEFSWTISKASSGKFKVKSDKVEARRIFKTGFSFQELGIGGLDKEFEEIFRRAFNSRRYSHDVIEKYGIKHVRGMLLYGPPGTGKTLIARQIAKALDCDEPKIVNGPEIFSKYQGESEKNVRELFAQAEKDMKQHGEESKLHIIIFDEIDAICRQRGSTSSSGTGVHETVVNQLLSKMDGVDSLNNILVIGMTNRKDIIDEAMLRPGRLEIHLEISLPDEKGRLQIFNIHTKRMRDNDLLDKDVDLPLLASKTKNYTGAEIEAVCRSATSFALFKDLDLSALGKAPSQDEKSTQKSGAGAKKTKKEELVGDRKVCMADFLQALEENKPAFGVDNENLVNCVRGGIIHYGETFNKLYKDGLNFVSEIKNSKSTPLLSILLEGKNGCGKTALAAKLALESKFPYVKMISPENFVGYSEPGKISQIVKVFEDAYKSPLSLIILDDLERLIEFIHIGPRFSNPILQALLVLIKKRPPNPERKLMILGTTSMKSILQEMELVDCFNVCQHVPTVRLQNEITTVLSQYKGSSEEIRKISQELTEDGSGVGSAGIPIKNLLLSTELAMESSRSGTVEYGTFMESFRSVYRE